MFFGFNGENPLKPDYAKTEFPLPSFIRNQPKGEPLTILIECYRSLTDYKYSFQSFFDECFPTRHILFKMYGVIKSGLFNVDILPQKVVSGNDDWKFLGNSHNGILRQSKAMEALKTESVNAIAEELTRRHHWLEKQGVKYYIAIPPTKLVVYGAMLPIKNGSSISPIDQVARSLPSYVNFLSLKKSLLRCNQVPTFHKSDTHWNDYGAFCAYQSILNVIHEDFPGIQINSLEDYELFSAHAKFIDLSRMIQETSLETQYFMKRRSELNLYCEKGGKLEPYDYVNEDYRYQHLIRLQSERNNLKIVVFRDSFGMAIAKFIGESFGESVFVWSNEFDGELIEREKPDIVLDLRVDRLINRIVSK